MKSTKIEWCDHTWSPWRGCTKVSPGCAHCYAEKLSKRNPSVLGQWGKGKPRVLAKNWGDPVKWNQTKICADCGEINRLDALDCKAQCCPDSRFRKPRVFPSLCDWLDEEVSLEWLAQFLRLVEETPNLQWLLLTKRPLSFLRRMAGVISIESPKSRWVKYWLAGFAPENVFLGTSVEDQQSADERIRVLLDIPACVRFLSVEPLIAPVDLRQPGELGELNGVPDGIHWVIIGGESGPGARPCNIEWIRNVVTQCKLAGVPCFVKQLGAVAFEGRFPGKADTASFDRIERLRINHPKGGDPSEWPKDLCVRRYPKFE